MNLSQGRSVAIGLMMVSMLSACAEPEIRGASPDAASELKAEQAVTQAENLSAQLSALTRKGEVLDKVHEYQPFIRVLNVYIKGHQTKTGLYTHPKVVSVPLIYYDQSMRLSAEAVSDLFSESTINQHAAPSTEPPASGMASGTTGSQLMVPRRTEPVSSSPTQRTLRSGSYRPSTSPTSGTSYEFQTVDGMSRYTEQ